MTALFDELAAESFSRGLITDTDCIILISLDWFNDIGIVRPALILLLSRRPVTIAGLYLPNFSSWFLMKML